MNHLSSKSVTQRNPQVLTLPADDSHEVIPLSVRLILLYLYFTHSSPEIYSFYLLPGRSHSWAQQPFHQFFLQHDGIHPTPLQHWRTKIATGLSQGWKTAQQGTGGRKKRLIWGLETGKTRLSLSVCSRIVSIKPLPFVVTNIELLFLLLSFCLSLSTLFFLFFLSSSLLFCISSAPQRSDFPCSDRYRGILTEREGNTARERERGGNLREETREGWKKRRSKRNSFIRAVLPPPAQTVWKIKLWAERNDQQRADEGGRRETTNRAYTSHWHLTQKVWKKKTCMNSTMTKGADTKTQTQQVLACDVGLSDYHSSERVKPRDPWMCVCYVDKDLVIHCESWGWRTDRVMSTRN